MNEEKLRTLRLEADAGPLRESVLAAARGARREQRIWRWTWAAAAVVLAVAIPVNLSAPRIGGALVAPVASRREEPWPEELQAFVRARLRPAARSQPFPRCVEEIR